MGDLLLYNWYTIHHEIRYLLRWSLKLGTSICISLNLTLKNYLGKIKQSSCKSLHSVNLPFLQFGKSRYLRNLRAWIVMGYISITVTYEKNDLGFIYFSGNSIQMQLTFTFFDWHFQKSSISLSRHSSMVTTILRLQHQSVICFAQKSILTCHSTIEAPILAPVLRYFEDRSRVGMMRRDGGTLMVSKKRGTRRGRHTKP